MIARHHHHHRRRHDDDDNDNYNHRPMAVGVANEFLFRHWFIYLSLLTVKVI
jgi:hypothetical protein